MLPSMKSDFFNIDALGALGMDVALQHVKTHSGFNQLSPRNGSASPQVETPPPSTAGQCLPRVAPLSQEEKQERQRMHVRRSYYKKRNYIRNLRDQVEALEKQYAHALATQPNQYPSRCSSPSPTTPVFSFSSPSSSSPTPTLSSPPLASAFLAADLHDCHHLDLHRLSGVSSASASASPDAPASADAVQDFMQLSTLRDTLRHENDELKKALIRYANYVRRVQQAIEDAATEALEDPSPHMDVLDFSLTHDMCMNITFHAFEEIQRFIESDECVSTGVSLFGWRDQRRVLDGFVQFSVKKFYNDRSALELSLATWDVLSHPATLAAMYSPSLSMDLRLIQRVDEDNVVFYRRIAQSGSISKSIFLLSRFRTDLGYVVLLRTCDSETQRRQRALLKEVSECENESWHDVFGWILLEELGDLHEHAQFSFGGRVDTTAATPQFWMLEVLLLSLRWEASVVGPMFTLS